MTLYSRIALVFGLLRGFQLALLTVPWVLKKVRSRETTETERSLVLMIGSRSILLGVAMMVLGFTNTQETLGWVLVGDGLLQLFDALRAFSLQQRNVAALPAILCVLDGVAGVTLLW